MGTDTIYYIIYVRKQESAIIFPQQNAARKPARRAFYKEKLFATANLR